MKPPPFEYVAPLEIQEALELLGRYGEEAKILAGGQSLIPLMSLRLARPAAVIDINRLAGLNFIAAGQNGSLVIGALTRQRIVERSSFVRERSPLLAAAMPLIGHFQIRNRGTIGGSLAHADPAAELPAVTMVLGAEFLLRSAQGERIVRAEDFFLGVMTTALQPDELLIEIRLPKWKRGLGWAVEEIARRKGDFSIVGVAATIELDQADLCQDARIAVFGVGARPARMARAEEMLSKTKPDERLLGEIGRAVSQDAEPDSDVHASAEYRRELSGILTRRALEAALTKARAGGRE
jgi:carbon-monoxide dehydrogenase medium subunit